MLKFLDLILNKLPVLKKFDGYKTITGGVLIAVGTAAVALGVVGLTGKAVKDKVNG